MHPWLLEHPPISTYGVCIVVAIVAAWLFARHLARGVSAPRIDPSRVDLLIPLLMATGLAGAWLGAHWTDALTGIPAGGVTLIGALLLGTVTGAGYALLNKFPLGVFSDIFAAPIALAIAGGRIGCFFAGCCYGKTCEVPALLPLSVHFPSSSFVFAAQFASGHLQHNAAQSLPVYPVQLFESAACLVLAGILLWQTARLRSGKGISGEAFLTLGLGYAVIRFALEFLRADNPPVLGPLTFSQCGSIFIATAAAMTWWIRRRFAAPLHLKSARTSVVNARCLSTSAVI